MLAHASCLARYVLLLTLKKALLEGCPMFTISQMMNNKNKTFALIWLVQFVLAKSMYLIFV
jgi:hypothetical protein